MASSPRCRGAARRRSSSPGRSTAANTFPATGLSTASRRRPLSPKTPSHRRGPASGGGARQPAGRGQQGSSTRGGGPGQEVEREHPLTLLPELPRRTAQAEGPVVCAIDDADRSGQAWWSDLMLSLGRQLAIDLPVMLVFAVAGPEELGAHEPDEPPSLFVARQLSGEKLAKGGAAAAPFGRGRRSMDRRRGPRGAPPHRRDHRRSRGLDRRSMGGVARGRDRARVEGHLVLRRRGGRSPGPRRPPRRAPAAEGDRRRPLCAGRGPAAARLRGAGGKDLHRGGAGPRLRTGGGRADRLPRRQPHGRGRSGAWADRGTPDPHGQRRGGTSPPAALPVPGRARLAGAAALRRARRGAEEAARLVPGRGPARGLRRRRRTGRAGRRGAVRAGGGDRGRSHRPAHAQRPAGSGELAAARPAGVRRSRRRHPGGTKPRRGNPHRRRQRALPHWALASRPGLLREGGARDRCALDRAERSLLRGLVHAPPRGPTRSTGVPGTLARRRRGAAGPERHRRLPSPDREHRSLRTPLYRGGGRLPGGAEDPRGPGGRRGAVPRP